MTTRRILALLALASLGCNTDALYAYCTESDQCGERRYDDGDVEVTVPLVCIEASVALPSGATLGRFCTLPCVSDADCESDIGLPFGRCIRWGGDDASFCYAPCASDADCYPSSRCEEVQVEGVFERICLPRRT